MKIVVKLQNVNCIFTRVRITFISGKTVEMEVFDLCDDDDDFVCDEYKAVVENKHIDNVHIIPAAKKRKLHSAEEITEAVEMCVEQAIAPSTVAQQYEVHPSTVRKWVKQAGKQLPTKPPSTPSKPQNKITNYITVIPKLAAKAEPDNVASEAAMDLSDFLDIKLEEDWMEDKYLSHPEPEVPVTQESPGIQETGLNERLEVGPGLGSLLQEIKARRRPGVEGVLDSLLQESTVQELVESGGWRAFRTGARQRMERGVKRSNNQNNMLYLESGVRSEPRSKSSSTLQSS